MKKLFPLLITSFLAWLPTTDAQLTISGEDVIVCDNGTVSIDVSVSNFIDITSAQFAATWDPDVVQFTSVLNNMPASALYNTGNAPIGELRFSWFDANPPPGYTPTGPPVGSQIIFTINFNIVGDYTTDNFTAINFGSVPGFTMEIASTSGIIPNGSVVIDPGSVTIDDAVPPTITCPANVTVTAGSGQPSAAVTYSAPTVTDNCDMPATPAVCAPASGSMFFIGTTTVNCNATDGANNSSNCSFTVTVNQPPPNPNALLISADDFAIDCNDWIVNIPIRVKNFDLMTRAQFAVVWDELVLDYTGFTDSLNTTGHPTALYNFANTPTGEFRFSWFDADGVPGEDLPDSTVIFTLHFELLDENDLPDTVVITGVPGFGIEFSNTMGILGPGDYAFNHSIVSVIPDTIAPSITCPADQTLAANANCEATLPSYISLATATDNCTAAMNIVIIQTPAAGTVITDTTEVMLIAEDEAGLLDTCFFDVNFVDNTDPVITCPSNVSFINDLGECSAIVALVATATDNCGVLSLTDNGPVGDEFPVGTTTVTFTATDVNGNTANCQTTVTVADTEDPSITCPANISLGTGVGDCTAVVTWAAPTATDNCPNITVTCTPPSGTTFPIGDSTIVCIVEDQAGNLDTCTFVVTVFDDEAPVITCPANQTLAANANCEATLPSYISLATATDNCTAAINIVITQAPTAGTVITDTTEVMLIVEDQAGLLDTCFLT
ncbi:MAG: HYR domain-containing protein [Saprospiraceae bacterium]|nr:HYR domain-containing protein [Saprospiraceae bacterium]